MIGFTRRRLSDWGRWAKGGLPSMPTMSSTEKARIGRGGTPNLDMPPDIAEIDNIICRAEAAHKLILIVFYVQAGALGDKAARLNLSRHSFRRHLDRAEWYVNSALDCAQPEAYNSNNGRGMALA
jgi:hypothetical protein